jgi:hypothetical protein
MPSTLNALLNYDYDRGHTRICLITKGLQISEAVPSSAPVHLKSVTYLHGVHKNPVLVSIVVSTSPRFFARVLRRTHNSDHAGSVDNARPGTSVNVLKKVRTKWGLETLPGGARRQWPPPRPGVGLGTNGGHTEGVYYLEWREDGRHLREAIPNPAEVLERARLKSLKLEARKARGMVRHRL